MDLMEMLTNHILKGRHISRKSQNNQKNEKTQIITLKLHYP